MLRHFDPYVCFLGIKPITCVANTMLYILSYRNTGVVSQTRIILGLSKSLIFKVFLKISFTKIHYCVCFETKLSH